MDSFLENEAKKKKPSKQVFRLHRRLFLLVCAVAILAQTVLFISHRVNHYYQKLHDSFKVILTVDTAADNEQLRQWGESLNQKEDVSSVRLFSPQDGLEAVRRQNPQLTEALLLMGKTQMPAYFELKLNSKAINNIRPFMDNLSVEYPSLSPRYHEEHAQMLFYTGLCAKSLNIAIVFVLLLFLIFMFLVEAYPAASSQGHAWGGAVSGLLAGAGACAFFAVLVYPTGLLQETTALFATPEKQGLFLVFCGLLGWTLSKWQKF